MSMSYVIFFAFSILIKVVIQQKNSKPKYYLLSSGNFGFTKFTKWFFYHVPICSLHPMSVNYYMIQFPTFVIYIFDEALFFVREMQGDFAYV